ncbi:glycosyltransferase family 2 protein [Microlunatus sp. Y2014]|uniref:glycosyltransferase family 2 protein n=1 Tax=Microlunatus sp. Y2014 TaxID=3418488 RepID=UPI003DA6FD0B
MSTDPPPTVSVVIPFRDVAPYLEDCLASVAGQTHQELEVCLVDDGSTDGSTAIARRWADTDPRFQLLEGPGEGVGPARNHGVGAATAPLLTFVDGDDVLPADALERMVQRLLSSDADLVLGNADRMHVERGTWPSAVHADLYDRARTTTLADEPGLARDRVVWGKVITRERYDRAGLTFPPGWYEDHEVAIGMLLAARTIVVEPGSVYQWRIRHLGASITQRSLEPDNLADRLASAERVDAMLTSSPDVRRVVHASLARVDLVVLLQSFAVAGPDQLPGLLTAGRRLLALLDPAVLSARPRSERLQHRALTRGWVWPLRQAAVIRAARRGLPELATARGGLARFVRLLTRR